MLTILASPFALAATYDPELEWRTLSTEHFDIHFHQGIEQVADEFSSMTEDVYATLRDEIRWRVQPRIQVVLVDRTDSANGFATAMPYPSITIYVTAPTEGSTLNLYEDWNRAIFTHELTHVLHLDTNHGIVRATRALFGRIASTNAISPGWMIEGFATFEETRQSNTGRGRSAAVDMLKRTAVVEDAFPPLGNLDGFQPNPPAGNLRYLWGQDFIQYVADHQGPDVWTKWAHTYGGWVPFWLPTERAFGEALWPLYQQWRADSFREYTAQAEAVRAEGETIGRVISDPEASCVAPAFSPDGEKLVWSCYDLRTGSAIWMADGDGFGPERLLQNNGASYFTWRSDSKAFAFAAVHLVNRFNTWSDIYLYPLGGSPTALTSGARARDPDFAPDGSALLYVTNKAQDNQLERMTVDRRRVPLTDDSDHTQYSTPRFSPDGRVIALSIWKDGQRDLWLYDGEDATPVRRLTMDAAIEADPTWSRDGRYLFFASDRSGIPNVYAIELATERLWQVTNVVTGATKPSIHPDGKWIAYQQYTQDGWEVRMLPLDPATFLDRGELPRPLRHGAPLSGLVGPAPDADPVVFIDPPAERARTPRAGPPAPPYLGPAEALIPPLVAQQTEVLDNFGDVDVKDAFGEEEDYPFRITPHKYNPLPSLLPRYVLPTIRVTPYSPGPAFDGTCRNDGDLLAPLGLSDPTFCRGLIGTLSTSAVDALSRYAWGAALSYRTDAQYLSASAAVTINRFLPVYSFGASTTATASAQLAFVDETGTPTTGGEQPLFVTDPPTFYWDRRTSAFATVSWPYKLRATLFAQYAFTDRRPRFDLPSNVYEPSVPFIGTTGTLSAGYRYAWSEPTAYAISAEDGRLFSLVASLRAPWLGAFTRDRLTGDSEGFTQLQVASEVRQYWTIPYLPNHVLAARAAVGATIGNSEFFGNYVLGGSISDSGFLVTPDEFRMVRGYPFATDVGDLYWLGSLEYRLPLFRLERGVRTLPVYGRTLSGAVFVDTANAFVDPSLATGIPPTFGQLFDAASEDPLVGVGAELTFRTILAWRVGLTGRIGYAVALVGDGYGFDDPLSPLYFQLGGSF